MHKSQVSSNLLYHFTNNVDILVSILENGFWPSTAIEDISFMMPNNPNPLMGIPMVCFTDIPIELANEHRKEYGKFGLGLKKQWGISKGLNPICYVIKGSELYRSFNKLQYMTRQNLINLDKKILMNHTLNTMYAVMDFAGYMKEYSSDVTLNSKPFYDEREWRYLPPFIDKRTDHCNRLVDNLVYDKKEKTRLNLYMKKHYTLKFRCSDVEKLILPDGISAQRFIAKLHSSKVSCVEDYIRKIVVAGIL